MTSPLIFEGRPHQRSVNTSTILKGMVTMSLRRLLDCWNVLTTRKTSIIDVTE
jgi:hypothetical protein